MWSPEQIAGWLRAEHPDDASMWVSHETIYRAIYTQTAGMTPVHAACLRSGRTIRRPPRRRRHGKDRRGHNPNMVLISERPQAANDRSESGHWEGDLVFGSGHRRALATLVERVSRFTVLLDYTDGFSADAVADDLIRVFGQLPAELRRSLTWDQGSELAAHVELTARSGIPVYFCNPRSPWQRPTNENTNGLLRQSFPRGVSLAGVTRHDIDRAARMLNNRPRHVLNWLTPAARLAQLRAATV